MHAAHLARRVNETITVVLVFERNAELSVERQGLFEVLGEDDDRSRLSHEHSSCHAPIRADHIWTFCASSASPHTVPHAARNSFGVQSGKSGRCECSLTVEPAHHGSDARRCGNRMAEQSGLHRPAAAATARFMTYPGMDRATIRRPATARRSGPDRP